MPLACGQDVPQNERTAFWLTRIGCSERWPRWAYSAARRKSHNWKGCLVDRKLENVVRDMEQSLWPSWLLRRAYDDVGLFGLLLTSGTILAIQSIDRIYTAADGSIWLDVTLADALQVSDMVIGGRPVVGATCKRLQASVALNSIMAGYELADT